MRFKGRLKLAIILGLIAVGFAFYRQMATETVLIIGGLTLLISFVLSYKIFPAFKYKPTEPGFRRVKNVKVYTMLQDDDVEEEWSSDSSKILEVKQDGRVLHLKTTYLPTAFRRNPNVKRATYHLKEGHSIDIDEN